MIVYGGQERICSFIRQYSGDCEHPEACQTIAWEVGGELEAALAFHHANGSNCYADIVLTKGNWPRALAHAGLWYAFGQLKLRRLTFLVTASNIKSINLVEKLGAYREATLQDGCSDGDAYIYCLRPDKCRIWSRLNGKIQRVGSSSP
jgi:hypothetical protein